MGGAAVKMQAIALGFFYILLSAFCVACANTVDVSSAGKELRTAASYCEYSPWCNIVAVEKSWPSIIPDRLDTALFNNGVFAFQLPRQFHKISVLGTPPMVIARYTNHHIAVISEKIHDHGASMLEKITTSVPTEHKLSPLDYIDIMFTKTLADPEPDNQYDRILWRAAFSGKSAQTYSSVTSAEIYRREPWAIYVLNLDESTRTRDTMAIRRDQPGFYLRIVDKGASLSTILDLVATATLDR